MSSQQFEQHLQQQIDAIPKDVQPEKDLWSGIDIAITRQDHNQRAPSNTNKSNIVLFEPKMLALAASFLAVAVLSWNFAGQDAKVMPSLELVNVLTQQHAESKGALLASYSQTQAVSRNWQMQLKELEAAADAIRVALENEPENVALLKMLQHVHQQQIDLIESVHAPAWNQI